MHNLMNEVSNNYILSDDVRNNIIDEMENLLSEYDYNYTRSALNTIIDRFVERKGRVLNILSKHPNWNSDKLMIQFNQNYKRAVDINTLDAFFSWCKQTYAEEHNMQKSCIWSIDEVKEIIQRRQRIADVFAVRSVETVNGITKEENAAILLKFREYYYENYSDSSSYNGIRVSNIYYQVISNLDILQRMMRQYFIDHIDEEDIHLCPNDLAMQINDLFPDTARTGQKISKILTKIGTNLGLNTVVQMRDASFYDNNGRFVEKEKNYGWAYQQTQMGDAINPFIIERHTLISANPVDYLTMSFGHKWGSCHGIDKGNREGNNYRGEYCAGTVSYMVDPSSFIFYTVDNEYEGTKFELQDKMQRCVMAIGGDKLYEGRVYPDGRDGGDKGLATQFRNVVQKVISDCLNADNLWIAKKGYEPCERNMDSGDGKAYEDWTCCSDSVMSFLKIDDMINEEDNIDINYPAICVNCGYENDQSEDLDCSGCDGNHYCTRCDERIRNGEGIETDDGNWYCDEYCANNDEYYYCADIDAYTSDFYIDDYSGDRFADTSQMIRTHDGHVFASDYTAGLADYVEVDGEWFKDDTIETDALTGEVFSTEDNWDYVTTVDCNVYKCAENAEKDGYIYVNGEWILKSETESATDNSNEEEVM